MKATRPKTAKELKTEGFKPVKGFESLFINETGRVYNLKTGKYLKPNARNYIQSENKYLSVPKLVLMTFEGKKYQNGKIVYLNGNKTDLSKENIKYSRLFAKQQPAKVNKADLLTAIRCYFEVDHKFKTTDHFRTRLYLQSITKKRDFFYKNRNKPFIKLYFTYIGLDSINKRNIAETAKLHRLPVRDCSIIINSFTNSLINEVLQDTKNGILHEIEFKPKQPTQTDKVRQINQYLTEHGQKPLQLRKKSVKQTIKDFEKYLKNFER